jgi:uncharacterized membrane protein YcaP (DUF421 family)
LATIFSVTNAFLIILTLIAIDLALSLVAARSKKVSLLVDGAPSVAVDHGMALHEASRQASADVGGHP